MPLSLKIGMQPTITTTTTNLDGELETPSAFEAKVERPDGTETAIVPTVESVGVLVTTLPVIDQAGTWYWRVAATAGVVTADEGSFHVRRSPIAGDTP